MADLRKYLQTQKFSLKSSISLSDTTIELTAFNLPDGTAIASGDLGSVNYATIAPGTANEEQISFTGFSGTSLTGVTRGLKFNDDYTQDTDLRKAHAAGTKVVISNTSGFYGDFVNKYNDETVSGTLTVPAPTAGGHAATKDYVDAASSGSQLAYDRIVAAGTAGETIASGELVYFDDTANEWLKTDANTATTVNEVLLGIAQGAGTDGNPITGGVLLRGLDSTQTGMTIGVKLYASDTAGAIAESAGTTEKIVGFSKSATELYFDPYFGAFLTADEKDALVGSLGSPSSTNTYVTKDAYDPAFGDGSDGSATISSPTTLTSNKYYTDLTVTSTLTTDGYQIYVSGTLSGAGTIDWGTANNGATPAAPTNNTAIAGGAGGAASGSGPLVNVAGATGATATEGGNPGGNSSAGAAQAPCIGSAGQDGGTGGTGADGSPGTGTGGTCTIYRPIDVLKYEALAPLTPGSDNIPIVPLSQGQASGGGSGCGDDTFSGTGCAGSGGGGGAGGGIVHIAAKTWAGTFTIKSVGGNGGNGAAAFSSGDAVVGGGGGGAGGNGGNSIVVYQTKTWTGSYNLTGGSAGTGGAGANGGGTGASGTAGATGTSYEVDYSNLL